MTYPGGIRWNDEGTAPIIGIAAKDGGDPIDVLGHVTGAAGTDEDTGAPAANAGAETIYRKLNSLE